MKKVFYAHNLLLYGTPQEKRDIEFLEKLGYEVFNPNTSEYQEAYKERGMEASVDFIRQCDVLAFRALPGGAIPAGVWKEIQIEDLQRLVFEIPTFSLRKKLSIEETRLYLAETGQR